MTINSLPQKNSIRQLFLWSAVLLFLSNLSCEKNTPPSAFKTYLHIAHTRTNANPKMDSLAEKINYQKYDILMLGGDLAHQTSKDEETMSHIDSIFRLSDPNTLWALGNHDYSDLERLKKYTKRNAFYNYHKNGITFIILDTQDSLSNIIGDQKAFFENTVDSIEVSSHVIILHHKLIWMNDNNELQSQIPAVSNGHFGDCFYCINPNNFYHEIYPSLVHLKQKGVEVLCIGGDIGKSTDKFEYLTKEGIYFLASGIATDSTNNKALIFKHDINNQRLDWEYQLLSEL